MNMKKIWIGNTEYNGIIYMFLVVGGKNYGRRYGKLSWKI